MRGPSIRAHMAHMPGQCAMAQTPDGSVLFTSGVDAILRPHDIRVNSASANAWWRADTPQEPNVPDIAASDVHEKAITALAVTPNGNTLASASIDGFVRIFSLSKQADSSATFVHDVSFVQACARFGAAVRTIDFSPSGAFLAAAGEEPGLVKIVMTAQPSSVNVLRAPAQSPGNDAIIALAFDPKGDFVVTIGERGSAVVWDVDKCILVATVDLNGRKASSVTWAPDGSALVFGTEKGAVVVSRLKWFLNFLLEDVTDGDDDDDIFASASRKNEISTVSWSTNGRYVLTARKDCNVSLWDVYQKKVLGAWRSEHVVQIVQWHSKTNAFVIVDQIGQWGIVADVVPSHMPSPLTDAPLVQLPAIPNVRDRGKTKKGNAERTADDGDEGAAIKRSKKAKIKRQKMLDKKKKAREAKEKREKKTDNEFDAEPEHDDQELENSFSFNPSDVEADDEDDVERDREGSEMLGSQDTDEESDSDEDVPGELAGLENGGVRLPEPSRKRGARSGSSGPRNICEAPTVQTPFMPSATPLSEKVNKKARILVWNLIGAVLSFDESTHDVVEVEFADASRRTVGIKDHFGYTFGCLSETGVFLGSNKTKEHGSVVSFRPFSSWALNADWTQFMPVDEDISVIALGQRFAAVATSPNNVIRIFSLSGLQTAVFGVPGTIITASAGGDMLAIVYTGPGSSMMKVEILEINSDGEAEVVMFDGGLMFCADSKLEWVGFTSDSKEFCSYDSNGWLWMMTDVRKTRRWVPVVQNAAKSAGCDWFWAASVTSEKFIGAPCLSSERYPAAKPRPGLHSISLTAPVIERITKNGKPTVAERLGRMKFKLQRAVAAKTIAEEMYNSDDDEIEVADEAVARMELETDKCVLSLMEDACRREQNLRALDLATRLHCKVSFKYAVELAKHFKRTALVSRVEHVAAKKVALFEDEERARETRTRLMGTSPVSIQHGNDRGMAGIEDHGDSGMTTPTSPKRVAKMDFSDGEKDIKHVEKIAKGSNEIGVTDVTDDEEEKTPAKDSRQTTTVKDEEALSNLGRLSKSQDTRRHTGDVSARGTKRRVSATQSQASVKASATETVTSTDTAKKAKVVSSESKNTIPAVNPKFQSFRNRFQKKQ